MTVETTSTFFDSSTQTGEFIFFLLHQRNERKTIAKNFSLKKKIASIFDENMFAQILVSEKSKQAKKVWTPHNFMQMNV